MRVALVTPGYAPRVGGVETHVAHLAAHLSRLGVNVEVLTEATDRREPELESVDDVSIRRFRSVGNGRAYACASGLFAYLVRHRGAYDVVHAHQYHDVAALGAAAAARSLVFTPHYMGAGRTRFSRALHAAYRQPARLIFARARRVICVTKAEAQLLVRDFPSSRDRVVVIPNAVDAAGIREQQPYPGEDVPILTAGRLEAYKRFDRVLYALGDLEPFFSLVVVGDGSAKPALESLAAELGVRDRVRFTGQLQDVELWRWYRTVRTFVTMSEREAFGLTVCEAVAAGARVVASDIPAHREVSGYAGPGQVRLVSESASSQQLANVIRETASAAAGGFFDETNLPSWPEVARRTLEVYRATLTVGSAS